MAKLQTIRATVEETIVVVKEVEVTVPIDATNEDIRQAIKTKAYMETVGTYTDQHGWKIEECVDSQVSFE